MDEDAKGDSVKPRVKAEMHMGHTDYICESCNARFHSKKEAMEHGKMHRGEHLPGHGRQGH